MDVPNLVRKISKFNRIQEQFPLTKHVSQHSKAVIFVKSHFSLEPKKRWNVNKEWRIKPSFFDEMEKKSSLSTTIHDHEQESSEKSIRRKENGHAIKIKRFCANTEDKKPSRSLHVSRFTMTSATCPRHLSTNSIPGYVGFGTQFENLSIESHCKNS